MKWVLRAVVVTQLSWAKLMQLAQEQGMIMYSSLLPKNLLNQLLQNSERRLILIWLLIAACFPRLPTSAIMKCALPKWVSYSLETFCFSLQRYCCCWWFKWACKHDCIGETAMWRLLMEQMSAPNQEVNWNRSYLRVCLSSSLHPGSPQTSGFIAVALWVGRLCSAPKGLGSGMVIWWLSPELGYGVVGAAAVPACSSFPAVV